MTIHLLLPPPDFLGVGITGTAARRGEPERGALRGAGFMTGIVAISLCDVKRKRGGRRHLFISIIIFRSAWVRSGVGKFRLDKGGV